MKTGRTAKRTITYEQTFDGLVGMPVSDLEGIVRDINQDFGDGVGEPFVRISALYPGQRDSDGNTVTLRLVVTQES